ncbi:hypothetical protein [Fibrobacter sp.]|uniref:hypothetical protein n=1 Tax=Fibrobacter sp. TaxID=35828 RepID=UPI0025BB2824|nr:hypothetical protein [Fibrobacter sp.]MBR3070856.1 hypothetical protein [Fibrobacter sp.]
MKSKYFLLAAALFVACSDDSSSTSVNDTPSNNGQNLAEPSYTNCIQTVLEFQRTKATSFSENGIAIDSVYWDYGSANNRGNSIYTYKNYWTGTHIDSTYEAELHNGEWAYRTTINTAETKFFHEGNISTLISIKDGISDTVITYFDGDSLATTYTEKGGKETRIYVLKNDTIFNPIDTERIIVMDENDSNTCYDKMHRDGKWFIWDRYEAGIKNGMIALTKTSIEDGVDGKTVTFFMFRRKQQ